MTPSSSYRLILGLLLFCSLNSRLEASHAMGADISYSCNQGTNQYDVTVTFYRDCSGISAPASVSVNVSSVNCGFNSNIVANMVGSGLEVSPLCAVQLPNSKCANPSNQYPGVEQYVYTGTIDLGANFCGDFVFSFTTCCRNSSITNLQSPGTLSQYLEAELDNTSGNCANNSVVFTEIPTPFICVSQTSNINFGAYDPDGDSLSFSLVSALQSPPPGGNITYVTGLSASNPMTSTPGVSIDSITGQITINPTTLQFAVVTVKVEEWRAGVMVGSVMRDVQIVTQGCNNSAPTTSSATPQNVTGGTLNGNTIEVCPGDTITWDIVGVDPDTDNVLMTSNISTILPGATFTPSGIGPVVNGSFSWPAVGLSTGTYVYVVNLQDDACPIVGSNAYSFKIELLNGINLGPDVAVCGDSIQLTVTDGSAWTWTAITPGTTSNMSCTTCSDPKVEPAFEHQYIVTSNLSGTCKNSDTIKVMVPIPITTSTSNDTSICSGGGAALILNAPGVSGTAVYDWTPGSLAVDSTAATTTGIPTSTQKFYGSVTDSFCTYLDSILVTVSGAGPVVTASTDINQFCAGDSAQFSTSLSWTPACDSTTVISCVSGADTVEVGTMDANSGTYSPYNTTGFGTAKAIHTQYLYTAAELTAAGMQGGSMISGVEFRFNNVGSAIPGLKMKMGCTATLNYATGCCSGTAGISYITAALTEVIASMPTVPNAVNNWASFPFDHPYIWDGSSSLLVDICSGSAIPAGTASSISYEVMPDKMGVYNLSINSPADGCGITTGFAHNNRPIARFQFCNTNPPGATYTWAPTGGLSSSSIGDPKASPAGDAVYTITVIDPGVPACPAVGSISLEVSPTFTLSGTVATPDTVCAGESAMITTSPSIGGTFSYQWTPAASILGDTFQTAVALPSATTTYVVNCSNGNCNETDSVELVVSPAAPTVTLSRARDTICGGDTTQLSATGATNYSWSPGNVLDDSTLSNPIATLNASQVFTVTCDNGGCESTDIIQVLVDENCVLPAPLILLQGFTQDGVSHLSWKVDASLKPNSFDLQRRTSVGNFQSLQILDPNQFSFIDSDPLPGSNIYRVILTNENGATFESNLIELSPPLDEFSWVLFPNPSDPDFGISLKVDNGEGRTCKLEIFDVLGHKFDVGMAELNVSPEIFQIDTKSLRPGMYFLKLTLDGEIYVKAFSLSL